MSDKIEPALTPEDEREWAAWLALTDEQRHDRLTWARDEVDREGYTNIRLVAGKALYGQPFGFTWAEVDNLNLLLTSYAAGTLPEFIETDQDMHRLAGRFAAAITTVHRIAGLLPPRELTEE